MVANEQVILTAPQDGEPPAPAADHLVGLVADPATLGDGLVAVWRDPERSETTWFDTPDGRLARWGASVEWQAGQGWTVLLPGSERQAWRRRVRGGRETPPAGVTSLVTAFTRGAALEPAGRARIIRQALDLRRQGRPAPDGAPHGAGRDQDRDQDADLAAEILYEEILREDLHEGLHAQTETRDLQGEGAADEATAEPVRVFAVTAGPAATADLVEHLTAQLEGAGLRHADADAAAGSSRVRRAAPAGPPEITVPAVGPDATVADLLRHHLATWTCELLRYDPDIRMGDADEPVHQARVAARRLRWILRAFGTFLDAGWTNQLRADLRWLDDHQAAVRDADVTMLRLRRLARTLPHPDDAAAATRLAGAYTTQRTRAHRALLAVMREPRYADLLDRLIAAAQAPPVTPPAQEPAAPAAVELVAEGWRRLRRAAKRARKAAHDEELHRLRRRARQARYTAEAVLPVIGSPAARFARGAKDLQDELGEQHDAVVSQERLRSAALSRGRRLSEALAAGQLLVIERQTAEHHAAAWPSRWRQLSRKRMHAWLDAK